MAFQVLTFSSTKMAGLRAAIILTTSKNSVPRFHHAEPWPGPAHFLRYPGEAKKGWQGKPASRTSWEEMVSRICCAACSSLTSGRWLRVISRNVFVEAVLIRVTIPVGFVGAHRVLIPFAGETHCPRIASKPLRIPPIPAKRSTNRKA